MAKGPLLNSPSLSYLEVITSVNYILKASCLETRVLDFTNVSETMPQRPRVSYHEKVFKKTVKDIKKRSCNSLHPVLSHGYSWNVFLLTDFLTSLNFTAGSCLYKRECSHLGNFTPKPALFWYIEDVKESNSYVLSLLLSSSKKW